MVRWIFSMVIGFVMVVSMARARGAPIAMPDGVPVPAGFTVDDKSSRVYDYFHVEVSYLKGGVSVHEDYAGKTWQIRIALAHPNKSGDTTTAAVRTALQGAGWEILTQGGLVVGKRKVKDVEWWVVGTGSSGDFGLKIVQVGPPPHTLTLTAPAKVVETFGDTDDFPYLGKLPGSTLKKTVHDDAKHIDVTPPNAKEQFAGPPLLVKEYDVPPESSAYERMLMYRDALAKAGWTVIRATNGGDSLVIAHYAKDGRDLFAYLHDGTFQVADVGAQNEAKKLLDVIGKDGHVAIYGIYFDVDKDVLKPESEVALTHILDLMKLDAKLTLEVQGHTDNTGTAEHNQTLSDARAVAVKKWLVAHGVADKRLTTKGYGDTVPVGDNKTPEGRAKNRRVELKKL